MEVIMKVAKVNEDLCICCGACASMCDVFEIRDKDVAEAVKNPIPADLEDEAMDAADACPTGAISINEE